MRRILLMVFRNLIHVPIMWIRLCYHAKHVDKYTKEEHYALLEEIIMRANKGGNVIVKTYGKENIPQEDGFVIVPNHQGMFDPLALMEAFSPTRFSSVVKKEVENVQFLKQVFACTNAILIDRKDIRQSMQVINQVTEEVKKGNNYLIFPEGTRSKNGNQIGKFKGGSFKSATKAKCPIVPVALIDCFKPFDTNSIKKVTVQVHILEPLRYEDYKDMKTTDIAELVEEKIKKVIKKYENTVDN